jgi:hypothetical protein
LSSDAGTNIPHHALHGIFVKDENHNFFDGTSDKESPSDACESHGTGWGPRTVSILFEENAGTDIARKDKSDFDDTDQTDSDTFGKHVFGNSVVLGVGGHFQNVVGCCSRKRRKLDDTTAKQK